MALTGNTGYQAELQADFDLSITNGRYIFEEGSTNVAPGSPGTEHGAATAEESVAWGMAVAGDELSAILVAQIVEAGITTPYWVKAGVATVSHEAPYGACNIYRGDPYTGGILVNKDADSPYECTAGERITTTGGSPSTLHHQKFTLQSYSWAAIDAQVGSVGTITLADGSLESTMDRFLVNNVPYASDPALQDQFSTLSPGEQIGMFTERRNGETPGVATLYWSYNIVDGGTPTQFWVQGSASNEKSGIWWYHDWKCDIYDGDPLAGALVVSAPYQCEEKVPPVPGTQYWSTGFEVSQATVIDLGKHDAAVKINQGCATADSPCLFVTTKREEIVLEGERIGLSYANEGDEKVPYEFKYASNRSTTNSVDVTAGSEFKAFGFAKFSLEVTYGYKATNETDKINIASMDVPPNSVGWFTYSPSYSRFTGNYLFELDGQWYRAQDVTFTMPNDKSLGTLSNHHAVIGGDHPLIESWHPTPTPKPTPPIVDPTLPLGSVSPGPAQEASTAQTKSALATTGVELTFAAWAGGAALLAGLCVLIARRMIRRPGVRRRG